MPSDDLPDGTASAPEPRGARRTLGSSFRRERRANREVWRISFPDVKPRRHRVAALQPRWFRGAYRAGATVGFHVAQVLGQVVLAVLFLLGLTPLGRILRLAGKDLLRLKRAPKAESHWQPARPATPRERLF